MRYFKYQNHIKLLFAHFSFSTLFFLNIIRMSDGTVKKVVAK